MNGAFRPPCASCGRAIPSRAAWLALEQRGRMDDGDGGSMALANCVCGSTIAVDARAVDGPSATLLSELSRAFLHEAAITADDEERIRLYATGCELADNAEAVADAAPAHSATRMKCSGRYRAA